jgi:RND family efflux transporter MFP subunit
MKAKLITLLAFGTILSSLMAQGGPPPSPVKAAVVMVETLQKRVRVNGQVYSSSVASISPRVDGYAQKVQVTEGLRVKKGDVLLVIDDRELKLQEKALQASLAEVEADCNQWNKLAKLQKAEWEDLQKAEEQLAGTVSRTNLRRAEQSWVESEGKLATLWARHKAVKAQLEQLALQGDFHQLRAPFDGQVIDKKCAEGAWLRRGEAVLTLLNTEELEVRLDIPENYLSLPEALWSDALVYSSAGEQSLEISEGLKSYRVDPQSRSFTYIAKVKTSQGALAHGSAVFAQIPSSEKEEVLWIPTDAILKNDAGAFVYKVISGPRGKMVLPMPVTIRYRQGDRAILQMGALQKGDQVVIEGNERLFPTTPVQIIGE